jgi:hypothetical protein
LGIDFLDIFSLGQSTLVGTQTPLGKFVNSLVGTASPGLDHIQNSAFIRGQSDNLTGNGTAQANVLALSLFGRG